MTTITDIRQTIDTVRVRAGADVADRIEAQLASMLTDWGVDPLAWRAKQWSEIVRLQNDVKARGKR